jgi:maleate isomerase
MAGRTFLGMLTPSSNTVLEPICAAMLRDMTDVSAHFSRFRVTEIALDRAALGQFDYQPMLEAASLLADARVHSICWNGTSASWLGFDKDRALCKAITEATGIPATSAVLGLEEIFRRSGVKRFGLVSPYLADVQTRIIQTFHGEGFDCVAERHRDLRDNFSFSEVDSSTLRQMVQEVSAERPDAITILCTNLAGAPLVEELEEKFGIPIYDSTAVALRAACVSAGVDPSRVAGWGSLFNRLTAGQP